MQRIVKVDNFDYTVLAWPAYCAHFGHSKEAWGGREMTMQTDFELDVYEQECRDRDIAADDDDAMLGFDVVGVDNE